jgi:arsenical pump membrane protein
MADVALVALARHVPWRVLPVGAAALAAALAVLVGAAAPHLPVDRLVAGSAGAAHATGLVAASAVGANLLNNLPALLLMMGAVPRLDGRLWAVLVGVNVGPVLVATGSLSGLLWLDTAKRLGVPVSARTYSRVGVRVGLPALAAATVTVLLTNRLLA